MPHVAKGLVFGLDWIIATSDDKNELRQLARDYKFTQYAEAVSDTGRKYGYGTLKRRKGLRAAAAGLAEALPDGGVFIHNLEEGKTSLIVISHDRRLPVDNMDLVGTREEMLAAARKYIADHPDVSIPVYGDVKASEFPNAHEFSLERLVNDSVVSGELKPVRQINEKVVFGIGAGVFAVVAFFAPDVWDSVKPPPPPPPQNDAEAHKTQLRMAINEIVQRNQFPANVVAGFLPFANSVPWEAAGWKLTSLSCKDTDCDAVWKRGEGATSKGLLDALNIERNDTSVTFYDMDFARRKYTFKKGTAEKKLILLPNNAFSELVLSWMQRLKDRHYTATIGTLTPLVPPPAAATVSLAENPKTADIKFVVPYREVPDVANLPDVMTIEAIDINTDPTGKVSVEFRGKFYAL